MASRVQLTYSTVVVLRAIDAGHRYGFDIMDVTGLPSGTVYPALRRLERAGLLRSRWENERRAAESPRPPRRYYQITSRGRQAVSDGLERFPGVERILPDDLPRASERGPR